MSTHYHLPYKHLINLRITTTQSKLASNICMSSFHYLSTIMISTYVISIIKSKIITHMTQFVEYFCKIKIKNYKRKINKF